MTPEFTCWIRDNTFGNRMNPVILAPAKVNHGTDGDLQSWYVSRSRKSKTLNSNLFRNEKEIYISRSLGEKKNYKF